MEPPKWFALISDETVYPPYNIEKHENFVHGYDCLLWLRMSDSGSSYTTSSPRTYKIYNYDLLNTNGVRLTPMIGGWKLIDIQDHPTKNSYSPSRGWFADPWGKVRLIEYDHQGMDQNIILISYITLETFSLYDSWGTYDVEMKIGRLRDELEELKKLVEKLKS
jgi:hypothetical protein